MAKKSDLEANAGERPVLSGEENPKPGKMPKVRNIISGAIFWNFNEAAVFTGTYLDECKNEEGEVIGFNFADQDGEIWVLGKNYAIERALGTVLPGEEVPISEMEKPLRIQFLGKAERKSGGEFNRFKIDLIG